MSARKAPGATVSPRSCSTGTDERASTPKATTVAQFATRSEASAQLARRGFAASRRIDAGRAGELVEEEGVIRADRDDEQHADHVQQRQRATKESQAGGDGEYRAAPGATRCAGPVPGGGAR